MRLKKMYYEKFYCNRTNCCCICYCSTSGNGELIGIQIDPLESTDPYGMVFVPQGSFNMGPGDQDVPYARNTTQNSIYCCFLHR